MEAGLIDDFMRNILSLRFCTYHFVSTILSNTILSIPFCPYHFVRYHFVRYHFVLEPNMVVLIPRFFLPCASVIALPYL